MATRDYLPPDPKPIERCVRGDLAWPAAVWTLAHGSGFIRRTVARPAEGAVCVVAR